MGFLFVSASEIETFDLCPRKWAFVYIENKRPPPNDSAALGTRVHAILEKWLKEGAPPDTWTPEGEIAASGLHLLPAPRTPTLVTEEQFSFTSQRAWYTGFKDFRYRDVDGLIHVGDHKTTKSFTWAKTPEEILCHSQALIYAVDEFRKNPDDDRLALDWIYYKTTGSRKAEPRFQIVTRDVVAEMFFEHVDPVAGEITRLHHEVPVGTPALDFTPDFRSCEAFGGCPFLSICNPTPSQRVQATMTQAGMSLADKLKSMKAGRTSPVHPPEAHQAPQQPFVPQVPQAPQQPFVPQAAPMAPMDPALYQPQMPYVPLVPQTNGGVAPQVPVSQTVPQGQPTLPFPAAPAPQGFQAALPYPVAPAPQEAAAPSAPQEAAAPPQEASKKVRGRPKKRVTATEALEAPETEATKDEEKVTFTLYIGCAPVGVEATNALVYVNAAHDALKKNRGVSHYLETERGAGELCKELESLLALCEGTWNAPRGDVFLSNTQIEEDTASVWLSRAAKVVRAFR